MKQKINSWAHRNLAEIVSAIFVIVLITLGISAYNLWDRQIYQQSAAIERKRMIEGIATTVHNDSIQISNQDSLKEAAFKKNMKVVNEFINQKK